MLFSTAHAALAFLAVFNVPSSHASPVTWAQHARRAPQNLRTCTTSRLTARPLAPHSASGGGLYSRTQRPQAAPLSQLPPSAPSPPLSTQPFQSRPPLPKPSTPSNPLPRPLPFASLHPSSYISSSPQANPQPSTIPTPLPSPPNRKSHHDPPLPKSHHDPPHLAAPTCTCQHVHVHVTCTCACACRMSCDVLSWQARPGAAELR